MSIRELWKEIERDVQQDRSGYITRRVQPDSVCDLRVAVMEPQGTRTLLLKAKRIIIELIQEYPESAGFQVQPVRLPSEDPDYLTLQLTLTQSRYSDIFTALVDDIIAGVAEKTTDEAGLEEFIVRLKRWQAFLKANQPDGLSEEQQRGLYGELWFLRQVASLNLELLRGIQVWTGPQGTQQDFQFAKCAVEVKTTTSKQHQKLVIASERQLDDTGRGALLLLHLSLDSRQGGGETLPDMVASVRALLKTYSAVREEFENLLFAAGYLDIHASRYKQTGYTIREINYFKVEGEFPRIIDSDLRNGIGDVRYTISVAECKRFSIPEADVLSLLGGQS